MVLYLHAKNVFAINQILMNTYKIFLASSFELKADRDQFEIFINRKNKEWHHKGIFLELLIWEDTLDCMEQTRLQDKYNEAIKECDIFVLLFSTKVGSYTKEEFEVAYAQFLKTKKPIIFIYFKNISVIVDKIKREDQKTLWDFQDRLTALEHLQTYYEHTNDLLLYFSHQLDKLLNSGFIKTSSTSPDNDVSDSTYFNPLPHSLTVPPIKPEIFLGRDEDLIAIHELFFQRNINLLFITGEAGIGKTTLASEYYHRYQDQYTHMAWILSSNNIREALLSNLSQTLGVQYEEAMPLENRLDKLLITMNSLSKPCLLVIDDADDLKDLEELYLALRRSSNFHILLTTRLLKFHNVQIYPLAVLSKEKALELFCQLYPYHQQTEDNLFYKIREAIGGNTLVIEILAKNLAILNQNENTYSLTHLIEDIQKKGLLNSEETDALETTYHADHKMKYVKPFEIITAMYDISHLSPQETSVLSVFSVLPTENLCFKEISGFVNPSLSLKEILTSLSQKGWVVFDQSSRTYKSSPLIQEIIKKENYFLYEDCQFLIKHLSQQLEVDYKTGHPLHITLDEAARLSRFGESLLKDLPVKSETDIHLCDNIGMYHKVINNLTKAEHFFKLCHETCRHILEINSRKDSIKNLLAVSCKRLGDIQRTTGSIQKARSYFEEYQQLETELTEDNPTECSYQSELAISFERLGNIALLENNPSNALERFKRSYDISSVIYQLNPGDHKIKTCLAIANQNLGNLYKALGNVEKALEHCLQFAQLEKELSEAFPDDFGFQYGLGVSYGTVGLLYFTLNNSAKTIENFMLYKDLIEKLYAKYPQNVGLKNELAVAHNFLGKVYESEKDFPKAQGYIEKCYQLEKELFENFPMDTRIKNGYAISCSSLGELYSEQENHEKALFYYLESNRLEKELYEANPDNIAFKSYLANTVLNLGEVKFLLKDMDNAFQYYLLSIRLYDELYRSNPKNVDYKNSLAYSHEKIGQYYQRLEKQDLSLQHYHQAIQLWTELVNDAPGFEIFSSNLTRVQNLLQNNHPS